MAKDLGIAVLAWGLGTPGWPHPHPVPVPERQKWLLYQAHDNYSG